MESHWFTFAAVTLLIISLLGTLTNSLVIAVISRNRQLWSRQNILILTLACADLAMSTGGVALPFVSAVCHRWIFGHVTCQLYAFATNFVGIGTITILTVLAYDRAQIICRPHCQSNGSHRNAAAAPILIGWAFALAITCPPLFGWGSYGLEGPGISCSVDWQSPSFNSLTYILLLMLVGFIFPLTIILSSYLSIYHTIHGTATLPGVSRAEFRVTLLVASMVLSFLTTWLPYMLVAIFKVVATFRGQPSPMSEMQTITSFLPSLLAKSSIIYNPIIYAVFNTQFRGAWRHLFGCTSGNVNTEAGRY